MVYRNEVGRPLTWEEVDGNFQELMGIASSEINVSLAEYATKDYVLSKVFAKDELRNEFFIDIKDAYYDKVEVDKMFGDMAKKIAELTTRVTALENKTTGGE